MKQLVLLTSFFSLCITSIIAQKTISKEDFEHLVDYANCKYLQAFIELKDAGTPYFKDYYEKKVKPELEKTTLDNFETILAYDKLIELLSNNIPALQLAKKINERKLKFDGLHDNVSLINTLGAKGWQDIDLSTTGANIHNEILKKYNLDKDNKNTGIPEGEVVNTQITQTSKQVEELQAKLDKLQTQYENLNNDTKIIEYQKSFENFRLIVFSLFGVLFLIIVAIYLRLNKSISRENIIKHILDSKRIEEKFAPNDRNQLNKLKGSDNPDEKKSSPFTDSAIADELPNEKEIQQQTKISAKENSQASAVSPKYLKGMSGKIFSRVENTPENSFFKLFNEGNDTANFEFCGDGLEAIAKRIFSDDICKIVSGSYQNAHTVKTDKAGKIKRVGDQWEVTEPVEIKLV